MSKMIALLFFEDRNIGTYPSITNTAKLLGERGHGVKVFIPPCMVPSIKIENTEFISCGNGDTKSYIYETAKKMKNIDMVIAFSIEGLFVSLIVKSVFREKNIPTVYHSMELIYKNYFKNTVKKIGLKTGFFTFKRLYWYLKLMLFGRKLVKFGIAQDSKRCELLKEEFPFIEKTLVIPNSYVGFNESDPLIDMRERFNIPKEKKLLLFAGGVYKGLGVDLFKIIKDLNEEYVMVFNVYNHDGYVDEVKEKFAKEIKEGRIIINEDLLDEKEYIELVKSSHIGLVWYSKVEHSDKNMYFIGMSSGKLNCFLSCGKPVVIQDHFPGFVELKKRCDIGELCRNEGEIPQAIRKIENRYENISKDIREYYSQKLEFSLNFAEAYSVIEKVLKNDKIQS